MKDCQYGVLGIVCGRLATTKRQRPAGGTWEVCDAHAAFLDRLRKNIKDHAPLLERLRTGGDPIVNKGDASASERDG